MMTPPKSKVSMTDHQRIALCRKKKDNPSLTQFELCKWLLDEHNLKVTQGTVSNTLKRSAHLLSLPSESNHTAKRHKDTKYPLTERALSKWFETHHHLVNMSGALLKEKGKYFQDQLYPGSSFQFSNGWLDKFRTRHNIKSYRRQSVDMDLVALLSDIRKKLDTYEPKDIYNMDETGLNYRMIPDISLASHQLEGRKKDKERLTLTICCNGDGSDKLPLWVIGNSLKPRCFKNVNLSNINMEYRANARAGISRNLFKEWLGWFDARMNDRKVLLILDNCPAHMKMDEISTLGLTSTEVLLLPAIATSKIQPCDAGIIRSFKAYYRRLFHENILSNIENLEQQPEKLNVLQGINFSIEAWNCVKETTIMNCFRHCNIRTEQSSMEGLGAIIQNEQISRLQDEQIINELERQLELLKYLTPMDINILLNHPTEADIVYVPSEDDNVQTHKQEEKADDDDSEEAAVISANTAVEMLEELLLFWMQQPTNEGEMVQLTQLTLTRAKAIREKERCQL